MYPSLHRLEADGLIESRWTTHAGRRRRVYELTRPGDDALASRNRDWRAFARGMDALLEGLS